MSRPLSPASFVRSVIAIAAVLAAAGPARAQSTYYWDTNGTATTAAAVTGTWGTSAFWSTDSTGASATAAWVAGSNAVFSAGSNATTGTVTVSGTIAVNSITFDDPIAVTVSGGTALTLGNGTTSGIFATANGANTVSTAINLHAATTAFTFSNTGTSTQTISSAITGLATSGTQTITVQAGGTGAITLSGVIGNGSAGGTVAVVVNSTGTGITTLSGANTFTGGVTIKAGTGSGTVAASFGTGTITLGDTAGTTNATLRGAGAVTHSNAIVVVAGSSGTATISSNTSNAVFSGTVALNKDVTLAPGTGNLTLSGIISGTSRTITVNTASTGLAILSGANTFTGAVKILSGTASGTVAAAFGNSANVITIGNSSGAANATLNGGGNVTIANPITIASGNTGLATITSTTSTTTFSGAVTLSGHDLTVAQAATNVTLSGAMTGTGNLVVGTTGVGTATLSGPVTLTGNLNNTSTGGGATTITGALNLTGAINNTANVAGTTSGLLSINGNIANTATTVTQNGTSNLTLAGTNSYTGNATITAGTLSFLNTASMPGYGTSPATGFGRVSLGAATLGLGFGSAGQFTATDIANVLSGTYALAAPLPATGAALGLDTTTASTSYTTAIGNAAGTTSFGFAKLGTNTLTLGTANTFAGPVTVTNGTLSVATLNSVTGGTASSSLGAPTSAATDTVNLGNGATTGVLLYTGPGETTDRVVNLAGQTGGGTLDSSGTGLLKFTTSPTFANGAKTLTLQGAGNGEISAVVGNSTASISTGAAPLTITKLGTGTWTLSNAGTSYATTLVASGGVIDTGPGGLTLNNVGAATIQSNANATINGKIILGGVTAAANGADVGATAAGITLTINALITGGDTNAIDIWNSQPTSTTIFTAANTYSGQTAIAGQILQVAQINSVATNATLGTVHLTASNLGAPTTAANGIILGGQSASTGTGVLKYVGTGEVTDRAVALQGTTGGFGIDQSGTGLLKFVTDFTATGAGDKTFTLLGSTAGTGEIAGKVVDNSTSNLTSVVKNGTGTWTLSGPNTYTGATTVNAGNLILAKVNPVGSTGTLANTAITINAGGTLSPVAGFQAGNTATALAGASLTLNPGGTLNLADGTIGNFTLVQEATFAGNAVNLNGGTLKFDVGTAAGSNDKLVVTLGSVAGSGVAAASGANAVVLVPTGGSLAAGTYTLIQANGTLANSNFYLASPNLAIGGTLYNLSLSLSGTNEVLTVATGGASAAPGLAYWTGARGDGAWPTITGTFTTNWAASPAGAPDAAGVPGAVTNVFLTANSATNLSTTLGQNVAINSLTFTGTGTANTAGSTVAGGAGGPYALTINAAAVNGNAAGTGIVVLSGSGANTISANVVLGGSQTWTNNSTNPLTVSGVVSEAAANTGLTIAGTGTVVLGSPNTYTGPTTLSGGVLSTGLLADGGTASGIGMSTNAAANLVFGGGTLLYTGGTAATDRGFTLSGAGTINVATAGATLAVNGAGAGTGPLTKTGPGAITLGGASTYTGNTVVTGGTLNVTGSLTGDTAAATLVYGGTAATTVVNVSGNMTLFSTTGGNASGAVAVYNQTGGLVTVGPGTGNAQYVATAAGSYGYFNLTGGTYRNTARFDTNGTANLAAATPAVAVVYVGGTGTLDHTNAEWFINGYSYGSVTVGPGGTIDHTGSSQPFAVIMNSTAAGGEYGVLNVAGGLVATGSQPVRFGNSTTAGNGNNNTGMVNLAAGVLSTGANFSTSLPTAGANGIYYNFAGGTVRATAAMTSFVPATASGAAVTATIFGPVNNSAVAGAPPSFAGGLTVDTNGFAVTIPAPLLAATGAGVTQADLAVTGGTGYVGAPFVQFSSAGLVAGGTPAAGYALINNGSVVGIVITSPGTYTAGTVPTVTLYGGGGTGAGVTVGALNTANPTDGGLTKTGVGTLTLSGVGTFVGGATVQNGTLALGVSNAINSTNTLTVNTGGAFDVATFSNTINTVVVNGGSVVGTATGLLTSNNFDLRGGTVSAVLGGTNGVTKTTAGSVTLSGTNTFTGAVNLNAGTLAVSAVANLGAASTTLNFAGGTLGYTGSGALDLGAGRVATVTAAGGTVNVSSGTGTLTLSGGLDPASTGTLTKTGTGTLAIPTAVNAPSASVAVTAGTLNAGFGTAGIKALTVAGGTLSFANGAAEVLTPAGTGTNLTLSGGGLTFDLAAAGGASDRIVYDAAAATGTLTLNFVGLTGFSGGTGGTYTLLTSGTTTGGLANATFVLGSAPTGFNYSITNDNTTLTLVTSPYTPIYWTGANGTSWATTAPGTNFSSDAAGAVDAGHTPLATETVIFSSTAATVVGPTVTTTLDGPVVVDSLQFNGAGAVTSVVINPGAGGTLTVKPASSSGGIAVLAGGGSATIAAPLTLSNALSASQTWNVADPTSTLALTGSVAFGANVTKTGAGTVTLSGANTGTGNFTLTAGTLNVNSPTALGGGTLTVAAGTVVDNTSGAAITMTANNPVRITGDFTYAGTQSLNVGTGAVTLSNNPTVFVAGNTLTLGGVVGGASALTKDGAGALTLTGANTYTGRTTLTAGTLNLGNASALGTGPVTINGGAVDNVTAAALTLAGNPSVTLGGSFTFVGTQPLNLGTGAVTLTATPTVTTTASTLTVGGDISGGFGLTKGGAGTLTLTGTNSTYTGTTTAAGGVLNLAGTTSNIGGLAVQNATVNVTGSVLGNGAVNLGTGAANSSPVLVISGTVAGANPLPNPAVTIGTSDAGVKALAKLIGGSLTATTIAVGAGTTTSGAFYQTGGALTQSAVAANTNFPIGNAAGAYGYVGLTGGTATFNEVGVGGVSGGNNTLGMLALGGTAAVTDTGFVTVSRSGTANATQTGVFTIGGTASLTLTGATASSKFQLNSAAGATSVVNVQGGTITGPNLASYTLDLNAAGGASTSIVNLNGGTLQISGVIRTTASANPLMVNFNGGTLRATVTNASFMAAVVTGNAGSGVYVFGGGGTIHNNGVSITLAQPLAAPTGSGVTDVSAGWTGGSGYLGAPNVVVSGGGGTGATAVATMADDGTGRGTFTVTGITITNPGVGYSSAPTFAFLGGGATTAAAVGSATVDTAANVSGGMTFAGIGTTILTGASTYTGPTSVTAGTLQLGTGGSIGASSSLTFAANTTFTVNRTTAATQGTDFPATPLNTATMTLNQAGTGATTLTVDNAYGATNITAGTLVVGGGGTTGTLGTGPVLNNAALVFNRTNSYTLAATNVVTGTGSVTINSGTVVTAADPQFTVGGPLTLGTAGGTVTANLNLAAGGSTFGGMLVQTNTATANTVTIGAGKTLTITDDVTIGTPGSSTAAATTSLTMTGGGAFVIDGAAGNSITVQVGASTTSTFGDNTTWNMSGLASFTTDVATFRIGPASTSASNTNTATVTLPPTSTISASTRLVIGNQSHSGTDTLKLGSTQTTINTPAIFVAAIDPGVATSPLRHQGSVLFNTTTGNLTVRGAAGGTTRASLSIGVPGTGNTATTRTAVFDVSNASSGTAGTHSADLMLSTLVAGNMAGPAQLGMTGTFTFQNGTLNVNTIQAGLRAGNGTATTSNDFAGPSVGNINLGVGGTGGTVTLNGAVTLGQVSSSVISGTVAAGTHTYTVSGTFTVAGATVTQTTGGFTLATNTASSVTATGGTIVEQYTGTVAVNSGSLTVAGDIVKGGGNNTIATVTINGGTLNMNGKKIGSAATPVDVLNFQSGTLQNVAEINGGGPISKTTAGVLTLSGTNTYTGQTTLAAGTLNLNSTTALGTGAFVVTGGTTINNTSGAANTLANNNAQTWNGDFTFTGANNLNLGTGAVTLGATVQVTTTAGTLTVGGPIGGTGFGLTKAGAGTLSLTGASTYTGPTAVTNGTLVIGTAADRLPVGTTLTLGDGTLNTSGVFDLNGQNQTLGGLTTAGTGTANQVVNSGAGTPTLTVAYAGGTPQTFAGQLGGGAGGNGLALTKAGTGTFVLTGANTYTGATAVTGGALGFTTVGNVGAGASALGNPATPAAGTIAVGSGTTGAGLAFVGSAPQSTDRVIDLAGTTGGATLDASGVAAATITFTGGLTASGVGTKTLTLTGTNTGANTVAGVIPDSSGGATSLTKIGTGTWVLGGANTYTGPTTVSGGVLVVASLPNGGTAGPLGASPAAAANLVLDGGTLQYTGAGGSTDRGFTLTPNGGTLDASGTGPLTFAATGAIAFTGTNTPQTLTLTGTNAGANLLAAPLADNGTGATALTKTGSGTWVLTGANTYTGPTAVTGGTLAVNGSLGTGAVTVGTGATNSGTLTGTGTVGGAITVAPGGTLAPAAGTLTAAAGAGFTAGPVGGPFAQLAVTIGANGTPGTSGKLAVTGATSTLNFATNSALALSSGAGFDPTAGSTYVVAALPAGTGANIQVDGITAANGAPLGHVAYAAGAWAGNTGPVTIDPSALTGPFGNGAAFDLTRSGDNVLLTYTAPVPEPAAVGLFAAAAIGVGGLVRRRARSR
jgi:autotransporter-associated beta strand protein